MIKFFVARVLMISLIFFNSVTMFYVSFCFLVGGIMFVRYLFVGVRDSGGWVLIRIYFGWDKYSVFMIIIRLWIVGLIFISLYGENGLFFLKKYMVFLVIINVLVMFFRSYNFMGLYFFFEVRLIPTYFLVLY